MTIINRDCLAGYLAEDGQNARFDNWLMAHLCSLPGTQLLARIGGIHPQSLRDEMLKELRSLGLTKEYVLNIRANQLLLEVAFSWFEDTKRFYEWFRQKYNSFNQPAQENAFNLSYKLACILLVDIDRNDKTYKNGALSTLKNEWLERKAIGLQFDWIDGDNEAEKSTEAFIAARIFRPDWNSPESPESHEDLLITIDYFQLRDYEAKIASETARRKSSQKEHRNKSKNKKQLNVLIGLQQIKYLEKICQRHQLSKAKVIEILINSESEKNLYITEKKAAWFRGDIS